MDPTPETSTTDAQQVPVLPSAAEKQPSPSPHKRRKGELLPQINDLALEGHSCREIGARLGLSKTTVHRWLRDMRRECRGMVIDVPEILARAMARYETIYRQAMEAWRNSQVEEVRILEETTTDSGESKQKNTVRTERRAGDTSFLAQARCAVAGICKLVPTDSWPKGLDRPGAHQIADMNDTELKMLEKELGLWEDEYDGPQLAGQYGTEEDSGMESGEWRTETGRSGTK